MKSKMKLKTIPSLKKTLLDFMVVRILTLSFMTGSKYGPPWNQEKILGRIYSQERIWIVSKSIALRSCRKPVRPTDPFNLQGTSLVIK